MTSPAPSPTAERLDEPMIRDLVEAFYGKVRQDAFIGPVFENAIQDWPAHLSTLSDFWSSVMLGSGRYSGRPMPAHMALPIQEGMFERWLEIWGETVDARFGPLIAAEFRQKAGRIARSLSLAVLFRPEKVAPREAGQA